MDRTLANRVNQGEEHMLGRYTRLVVILATWILLGGSLAAPVSFAADHNGCCHDEDDDQATNPEGFDGFYIDIGASNDEEYIAQGFREPHEALYPCTLHPKFNDYTVRNQIMGEANTVRLDVDPSRPVHLSFCIGHGYAQDAWTLYANGHEMGHNTTEQSGLPIVYSDWVVDQDWLVDDDGNLDFTLELCWLNTSDDVDGAGLWAIIYWQE